MFVMLMSVVGCGGGGGGSNVGIYGGNVGIGVWGRVFRVVGNLIMKLLMFCCVLVIRVLVIMFVGIFGKSLNGVGMFVGFVE